MRKLPAKTGSAKILVATLAGIALIFAMTTQPLKLRDKPPNWAISNERYGIGFQLLFGKSRPIFPSAATCSGSCGGSIWQRNNFGPIYYERELTGSWPNVPPKPSNQLSDPMFPELQ